MSKNRYSARCDENQPEIVKQLRSIPGVTVSTNHDDILVGFNGLTHWIEIKKPGSRKKDGNWKAGSLKKSQIDLLQNWTGDYHVVDSMDEILLIIGINSLQNNKELIR